MVLLPRQCPRRVEIRQPGAVLQPVLVRALLRPASVFPESGEQLAEPLWLQAQALRLKPERPPEGQHGPELLPGHEERSAPELAGLELPGQARR